MRRPSRKTAAAVMLLVVGGLIALVVFVVLPKLKSRGEAVLEAATSTMMAEATDEDAAASTSSIEPAEEEKPRVKVASHQWENVFWVGEWPDRRRIQLCGVGSLHSGRIGIGGKMAMQQLAAVGSSLIIDDSQGDGSVCAYRSQDGPSINVLLVLSGWAHSGQDSVLTREMEEVARNNGWGVHRAYTKEGKLPTSSDVRGDIARARSLLGSYPWATADAGLLGKKLAAKVAKQQAEAKQEAQAQA